MAADPGQLQRASNCLPVVQGVVEGVRHAIWLRDRSHRSTIVDSNSDAIEGEGRGGNELQLEKRPATIAWHPPQPCNRKFSGVEVARCLVELGHRRIVLSGDSNTVKLVGRLRSAKEWWGGAAFREEFTLRVFTANDEEYRNHRLGNHAWWQDMELAIQERGGRRRSALISFRFNHGGYGFEGLNTTIDERACSIVAFNFSGLALKDGVAQWSTRLQHDLPPDVQALRRQPADVFLYSPGLWGLVDWSQKSEEQRASAREMVERAAAIVAAAPATKKVWMTTGRTDGVTKGFRPGIEDQRAWVLPLLDTGTTAVGQAKAAMLPMLLLDWWAVGDTSGGQSQGPVVQDFSNGGFHLNVAAQDALLHLIWAEVCGGNSSI